MLKEISESLFSATDDNYDEELIKLRNRYNYKKSYFALRILVLLSLILALFGFIYFAVYKIDVPEYSPIHYRMNYLVLFSISVTSIIILNVIKKKKRFIEKYFSLIQMSIIFVVILWSLWYMKSSNSYYMVNSMVYNQVILCISIVFYLSTTQIIFTYAFAYASFIGALNGMSIYGRQDMVIINTTITCIVSILISIRNYGRMIDNYNKENSIRNKNLSLMKINNSLHFANKKLKEMSDKDFLTNIANKRKLDRMTYMYWNSLKKLSGSLSIMIADIDFFKQYNDHYGHVKGDSCLVRVATAINEVAEKNLGVVGRYGGEEFFVILPNRSFDEALVIGEEIRKKVEEESIPNKALGEDKFVTISAGVATIVPTDDFNLDFFINVCDNKLYEAKKNGRNRIESIYL
jgi:diguanylate cyclase (GGDEF)-like protein